MEQAHKKSNPQQNEAAQKQEGTTTTATNNMITMTHHTQGVKVTTIGTEEVSKTLLEEASKAASTTKQLESEVEGVLERLDENDDGSAIHVIDGAVIPSAEPNMVSIPIQLNDESISSYGDFDGNNSLPSLESLNIHAPPAVESQQNNSFSMFNQSFASVQSAATASSQYSLSKRNQGLRRRYSNNSRNHSESPKKTSQERLLNRIGLRQGMADEQLERLQFKLQDRESEILSLEQAMNSSKQRMELDHIEELPKTEEEAAAAAAAATSPIASTD